MPDAVCDVIACVGQTPWMDEHLTLLGKYRPRVNNDDYLDGNKDVKQQEIQRMRLDGIILPLR